MKKRNKKKKQKQKNVKIEKKSLLNWKEKKQTKKEL